ncbi:hypothetical protein PsorP6_012936 [Peronosclerospora sorghi]|uniref:Uncharacterized protein n=1 Tax=Peronosclerospora sorghi TaxID=230839 RepID=A0ACC0WIT5_9STRA|nr:hypothetical protein PsorP6_012936 [Peronosclerospora sorghi]
MAEEKCCGCVPLDAENEYDMRLHIASIFIIFGVSTAGTLVPIISKKIRHCQTNSIMMEAVSAFAYGVVIATGLIHMISEGIEKLSSDCLGPIVQDYSSLGLAFVLTTLVLMHFIECESSVFFGAQGSTFHGHGHAHGHSHQHGHSHGHDHHDQHEAMITPSAENPYHEKAVDHKAHISNTRRKMATLIFEAGVIFHSVIIGVNLGVTSGSGFKTLLAAMCFHQFFEGVAIGTSAVSSLESTSKLITLIFVLP